MKIGIIIYSQTGNTYSVALKLRDALSSVGHSVEIVRLRPIGDVHPGVKNIQFKGLPDVNKYEAIIFGSPVWAFTLSSVMTAYLSRVESLKDKKVACYVTMAFPFAWLGGNSAIAKMKKICELKGSFVNDAFIINWSTKKRGSQISNMIESFVNLFGVLKKSEWDEPIDFKDFSLENNQGENEMREKNFLAGIYFLTIIGAAIYFIQHSTSFWGGVIGFLKALIWPLFVIYRILELLKL